MGRKKAKREQRAVAARSNMLIFPQDEKRVCIEATIYGMTQALADFPALKTDNIETHARIAYERVHRLSNNYDTYKKLFIECYVSGYRVNGEKYKTDNKSYKEELQVLACFGEVRFYAEVYPIVANQLAEQQRVKV